MLTAILLVSIFVIQLRAIAQPPDFLFKHITRADGLVTNQVGPIIHDSRGYVWIGTQTGLQRFDGRRFVTYLADVHNPDALQSDWINAIFEDSKKRFWVGSSVTGASLLDRNTGRFYNFNSHLPAGVTRMTGIWQFLEDNKGAIWLSAYDGFYRFNEHSRQFDRMNETLGMKAQALSSLISKDKAGNLWFATTLGVKMLSASDGSVYDRTNNPSRLSILDLEKAVSSVNFDTAGFLWASTGYDHLLYRFRMDSSRPRVYSFNKLKPFAGTTSTLPKEFIGSPFITSTGQLLISLLSRGIAVYQPQMDSFLIISADNNRADRLHLSTTAAAGMIISEDRHRNVWIGSDAGINVFNLQQPSFRSIGLMDEGDGLLPQEVSGSIQTENGDIFVSYYSVNGGISQFDKNFQLKKKYLWNGRFNYSSDENQLWYLFRENNGVMWAPNQAGNILLLDPANGTVKLWKDSLAHGPVSQIIQEENKDIWLANNRKGLIRVRDNRKNITVFNRFAGLPTGSSARAMCMLPDGDMMWVGTLEQGLQLFDKKNEVFREGFVLDENNPHSITNNNVTSLLAYNSDTLIVATFGGINIFNKRTKQFSSLLSSDGLPNNLVQAIALDQAGNLWAAFAGGLSRIDLTTRSINNYDEADGVIDNRFNRPFVMLQDGRMMIGASRSLLLFDPRQMNSSAAQQVVTITSFSVLDKTMAIDSLIDGGLPIQLDYTSNNIVIQFSALQINGPKSNLKYFYQLQGFDKGWIAATDDQQARYNQLPPGDYVFQVRCETGDGAVSDHITKFEIHIAPPFWQTWWFLTLLAILACGILLAFIKWREHNIRTIEAGKTRLQKLQAENYRAQFETEQISSFFSTTLLNRNDVDDVLWEVAKNLMSKLGLVDCIIYLWNTDKTKLVQKAGYGPKGSLQQLRDNHFDVLPGQGIVGTVAQTRRPIMIGDTSGDPRYRVDDFRRASEICVPILYNEQLIGVIDSEHHEPNFFTRQHLQALTTIATLVASKIKAIEAEQRLRQQKAELADINQQLAEVQLAALRSQMNPHFIFNALNSIKKFVIANEPANAEKYLGKFSRLIRSILDNSRTGSVKIEKELQLLRLYLELEQLRFGPRLTYSIEVDESVDETNTEIPSMIVQPFVENAMLHGIMHRDNGGHVMLYFKTFGDWLEVVIEDNGVGRKNSMLFKGDQAEPHHSIGIDVAERRLAALKRDPRTPAGITITDLADPSGEAIGTRVVIAIPIN